MDHCIEYANSQQKELEELVAAEEKRLGVGNREFMERHNEIMGLIEQAQKRLLPVPRTPARASNPTTC